MKKWIALLLVLVMCLSLCACGGGNDSSTKKADEKDATENSGYSESDFTGVWYDVATAQRLVVAGDKSFQHHQSEWSQPGFWEIQDNVFSVNSSTIKNDLNIISSNGAISLENDEFTFVRWENLPKTELAMGETGEEENVSVAMKNIQFVTELPSEIRDSSTYRSFGNMKDYHLGDGMVYAVVSFDVTNLSNNEIKIADSQNDVVLDYNNGFCYATYDESVHFWVSGDAVSILTGSGSANKGISVQPLQTKSFDVLIECPETIAKDENSPLHIDFIFAFGSPACYFDYTVR